MPHVIEPAAGADRATLAFLVDAYDEELVEREGAGEGELRTVLRLHPRLAPIKAAVLPLVRKDGQPELAREIHRALRDRPGLGMVEYDDGGAIGKRYRRQDEIGTPFCLTVDHQSLQDATVTLRERDSLTQERLADRGAGRGDRAARPGAVAVAEDKDLRCWYTRKRVRITIAIHTLSSTTTLAASLCSPRTAIVTHGAAIVTAV